jgi:hypothetical protein
LIIAVLLLLVISQLLLPGYFSNQLENKLKSQFEASQYFEAEVNSFPALLMLTGYFQSVNLKGEGLKVDGLQVDKLKAEFVDLKLSPGIKDRKWKLTTGENKILHLTFTEEDLEKYLIEQMDSISDLTLNLGPEQTVLSGVVKFLGNEIEVKLAGQFQLQDKQKLTFKPEDLMIENLMIHREIVQRLMKEVDFSLDLTQFPIPLQVNEVKVNRNNLLISGGIED